VTEIPWVSERKETSSFAVVSEQPQGAVALYEAPKVEGYYQAVPPIAVEEAAAPPPPPPPEEDICLKKYPDVNSQGYKCCKNILGSYRRLIVTEETIQSAQTRSRESSLFDCCMAPENTDGDLDRAETLACECKSRPDEPFCNCLGTHQAQFLNGCLAANGSADKFTFNPDPPSYIYEIAGVSTRDSARMISMPACACAAPQAYSAPEGACGIFGD
jgi:hypothetical protein